MEDNKITYFAETDARNKRVPFGIKRKDRSRHMYVIGKTGMGKSTLLENMAIQDIQGGEGMAFIDPHGKTAELLLDYVPKERINDVLYFAPFDMEYPVSFNVMEDIGADKRHLVVNGLMSTFEKIWVDAWSARMAYILNNTLLALLEFPGSTLLGVNRMLADKEYRKKVVDNVTDPSVRSFWVDEFAKYTDRFAAEATPAIQNKVGQFTSNPLVRNLIGQSRSTFDIRKMMDEKKIIIINLSKGKVGEGNANLIGSMLITKIYLAAMSRADASEKSLEKLPNFYLYVDEFQSFANKSFADILSEARKYKLNLTIAHQYIEQMEEEVRDAVFGNVGTMVTFRVGAYDAEILEKEFAPQFTLEDLVNLGRFQVYLKLMIDGVSSPPFSAVTLPSIARSPVDFKDEIIAMSRKNFARPRREVEEEIMRWHEGDRPIRREGADTRGSDMRRPSPPRQFTPASQGEKIEKNIPSQAVVNRNVQPEKPVSPVSTASPRPVESREVKDSRETALRNAISLNYLKDSRQSREEAERRKREKNPTQENLSALRNALATVMKDQSLLAREETSSTPLPHNNPPHSGVSPSSGNSVMQNNTGKTRAENLSVKSVPPEQAPASPEARQGAPSASIPYTPPDIRKPREIPEQVLKKVLGIEDKP